MKGAVDAGVLPGPRFLIAGPYINGGPPRNAMSRNDDIHRRRRTRHRLLGAAKARPGSSSSAARRATYSAPESRPPTRAACKVTGHLCSVTFTEAASLGIDLLQHGFITNSDYVPGKTPDVCPPENMRDAGRRGRRSRRRCRRASAASSRAARRSSPRSACTRRSCPSTRSRRAALEFLAPDTRAEVEANHADLAAGGLIVPPRLLQKMMTWERDFVAAGGLLGAGCDPWGTGFLPGLGNLRNYELLVQAGFTPEMSVRIMTLNGARILGIDARIGSVAVGKAADLMIVRGDPSATPADIYNVVTVFRDGVGFDSQRLRDAAKGPSGCRLTRPTRVASPARFPTSRNRASASLSPST